MPIKPEVARDLLTKATRDHRAGDLEAAEKGYRRLIELAPNFVKAWHNLVVLLRASGRKDEAIEALRKMVEIGFPEAKASLEQALAEKAGPIDLKDAEFRF